MMEVDLRQKMATVVEHHGEWTAMGIRLHDDVSTIDPPSPDRRLLRLVQLAEDLGRKPIAESRVLDLACLEGHYAVEFALHGAEVVGIEGRESNLAKCQFVKEALDLDRLTFVQDDVRNLSAEKYGSFDIVICSGILYHLDAPDVFHFTKRIAEVCAHLTLFDTFFSVKDKVPFEFEGKTYWGRYYGEHAPDASYHQRIKALWSSIDNAQSVWLTRPSLFNLLQDVGFTSVLECHVPSMVGLTSDRSLFVAVKGQRPRILSSSPTNSLESESWPEHRPYHLDACQDPRAQAIAGVKSLLPPFVRRPLGQVRAWLRNRNEQKPDGPWNWSEPWRRR